MNTKVVTGPKTRMSYVNVFDPKSINGSAPKYSVSLIIPKDDKATLDKIKEAIKAAYKDGEVKLRDKNGKVPPLNTLKIPLRDGDLEKPDDKAYENAFFINAKSDTAPGIVDAHLNRIMAKEDFYSGVYGRASITFYAYNSNGNKGIACGLNNLQKLRDGEPLGGRTRPEDDFSIEEDTDDFLN